jgi:ribosomal protein S18 acetylase RimI-like enzyme
MRLSFRRITAADVPALFVIRASVRENPFSVEALAEIGITPDSVAESLGGTLEGYLCESDGQAVGFALCDIEGGELSVIAVLTDFERRGIGCELLRLSEELLWQAGHKSIVLWTGSDRSTRALRLYLRAGWREMEIKDSKLILRKDWSDEPREPTSSGQKVH